MTDSDGEVVTFTVNNSRRVALTDATVDMQGVPAA